MFSKSRFGDVISGISKGSFEKLVAEHQGNKYTKGFSRWGQLVAMLYGHLSDCKSLRELEAGFNDCSAHHYHLGVGLVKRSTLADANTNRDPALFSGLCEQLMQSVHRKLKRELKELLFLLDSSPIHLQGLGFDEWAASYRSNVSQGLKLHVIFEGHSAVPIHARLTPTQVSDIKEGREMPIEPGATYVFDKGYYDYRWWHRIQMAGSTFVTRLKKNANISIQTQHEIPKDAVNIIEDATVVCNNRYVQNRTQKNPYYNRPLRRVTVKRPEHKTPLILICNDFERSAEELASLYKKRWDVELFFKWIKQNLKVKKFLGRSENAVRTHIYTALISYMLLYIYRRRNGLVQSMKLCLSSLKVSLFQRPDMERLVERRRRSWIDKVELMQVQLELT